MYCSKCGNSVSDKLKYCNSCGEKLAKSDDTLDTPGKMLDGILETLFWTAMGGLGILVGLVAVLLHNDVKPDMVGVLALAYLATLFGICFPLARQIPKVIDARMRSFNNDTGQPNRQELPPLTTAQLEEFREPAASVTDHTTRTLEQKIRR